MKVKLLVAALALVGAGAANAAINDGTTVGGSDLIFQAWDGTNSYVKDLGVQFDSFVSDPAASLSTQRGSAPGAASFNVNLTGLNTSTMQWTIFADKSGSTNPGSRPGVLTTSDATGIAPFASGTITSLVGALNQQIGYYNSALGGANAGNIASSAGVAYPGILGTNYAGALANGNSTITGLGSETFYALITRSGSASNPGDASLYNGQFTLAADGTLTYGSAPAAVPLPAAAWLFGSGLMGLMGVARRRLGRSAA